MQKLYTLLSWYHALGDKDRRIVTVMLVIGLPLLGYLLSLQPLYRFYASNKQAFIDNRELLQWIYQHKSSITPSARSPQKIAARKDLIEIVSTEAESQGVTLDRLQPQGDDKIRLWSQEIAFASLISWLIALQNQGLVLETITIDKTPTTGKVNFQGTLSLRPD